MFNMLPNLSPAIAREVFATLCTALPGPAIDTPENRAARDEAAMAAVAALHPADAFEAKLAAEIVAADASVMDCLRLAAQYGSDLTATLRCRAQATSTMRQMRSALRDLQKIQATREKAEATVPEPAAQPPQPNDPTEAESNAAICPARAERIPATGGLSQHLDFGSPEPDIALDQRTRELAEA